MAPTRRDFIADDDESLSEGPGDESDLDADQTSDDGVISKRTNANGRTSRTKMATRSRTGAAVRGKGGATNGKAGKAWEGQFERTWDQVQEDEHGTLEGAVSDLLLSYKSRR